MLGKHVFATLVYYDCLDYPLTAFEVWKHLLVLEEGLGAAPTLNAVIRSLVELTEAGRLTVQQGFYCLIQREVLIKERIRDEKISVKKLKRARSLIRLLAWVPFVRMIGITGSLAMKKSDCESDWDFFVVMRTGRIWTGRTLLTLVLQLLGKRRHDHLINNRACLNYFLTEEGLEIAPKDVFAAHEYRFLIPIFDRKIFRQFELANRWIAGFKPNFLPTEIPLHWTLSTQPWVERTQLFLENMFDHPALEAWLASWQRTKIERNPKTHLSGSFIGINERTLIFLPQPKGPKIFERFKTRLAEAHW